MAKINLGGPYRGLIGLIRGRRGKPVAKADLDPAERSFRHIWRYVKFTSSMRHPPNRKRPNLLVLQMGKVASLAIHQALNEAGINAFHSHHLSLGHQSGALTRLLRNDFTFDLASHQLQYHIHNIALGMLVRWYQTHKRYGGQKLKV